MIDPVYIGSSGLRAQQQVVAVISNNIANLNSISFKREVAHLQPLQSAPVHLGPLPSQPTLAAGHGLGVAVSQLQRNMSQGPLQASGQPLDLAVQGSGMFVLQRPDGTEAYARNGVFSVNEDGLVVDGNGNRLQPDIQINADASLLRIGRDGQVSIVQADGSALGLGQLQLARFANPEALALDGSGVYLATAQSGLAELHVPGEDHAGVVMQGFLESSNVSLVDEFTALVIAQRGYEASAKVVQAGGALFDTANGLLRT